MARLLRMIRHQTLGKCCFANGAEFRGEAPCVNRTKCPFSPANLLSHTPCVCGIVAPRGAPGFSIMTYARNAMRGPQLVLGLALLTPLFLAIAFCNGFPLMFYDTGGYLAEGLQGAFL